MVFTHPATQKWDVYVPLKPFHIGKSRFVSVPDSVRIEFIKAMASDLVDALLTQSCVGRISIVGVSHTEITSSSDPRLNSLLLENPVSINEDLSMAMSEAEQIAVFLPDLPAINPREIAEAFLLASKNRISYISDNEGSGSTAHFSTIGKSKTFFGPDSSKRHLASGAVELLHPSFNGLKRDLDNFDEMKTFKLSELGPATENFARNSLHLTH